MPRRPSALPPELLAAGVFTAAQAGGAGIPAGRLRRKDVEYIGQGLYRARDAPVSEPGIAAALLAARPEAVVSHLTAARLWGFPLPQGSGSHEWHPALPLDVSVPAAGAPLRRHGVRTHRADLPPEHRTRARIRTGSVPITTRERTWFDLASVLPRAALVSIGDHLVRSPRPEFEGRTIPWTSRGRLAGMIESSAGRAGVQHAREALALVRVGSDSPMETSLRLVLLAAGLPEPVLNAPVISADGRAHHEPDMQWPRWRVTAEYEGPHHRTPGQIERDIARAETIRRLGWTEVRIVQRHMRRGGVDAAARVTAALREHGWDGRP